jgi:hypothetical protein
MDHTLKIILIVVAVLIALAFIGMFIIGLAIKSSATNIINSATGVATGNSSNCAKYASLPQTPHTFPPIFSSSIELCGVDGRTVLAVDYQDGTSKLYKNEGPFAVNSPPGF